MFDLQRIRGAGLEEAVRQAPAAVIIVEATSGGIVLANEEAKATMGRSLTGPGPSRLEDFRVLREAGDFELYRPDGDAYEPEEWPLMRSIRTGEEVSDEEYDYVAADGTRGTMRCDASPIYDDEGRVVAGVGIFRDVTVQKRTDEQLRDQAQLLENVHDAVVATDERYFVTTWNRGAERMYGWTAEEAVGRKIYEVLPPEHGDEQVATVLGELSETGRYRTEAIRHHKDGTPVHVDSLTIALRGEQDGGQTTGYVGIHRDITERKLADGRLRESSRRTENILESITDAFYAVDRDWRFTYANERALHLSHWAKEDEGLTREDLLGKNMWEVFPDAVSTLFYEKYKEAMREQKVVDLEEYYSPGDVWVEVHAYPFEGGLAFYWRDITERKRAEEERTHHAFLLENVHDAVIATDARFVLTAWNKGAERMFGWTAGEALGREIREVLPRDYDDEQLAQEMRELTETGRWRGERTWHRKDGAPVHAEGLTIALREQKGEITGYLNITRDISERKEAEARLRESEERFRATFEQAAVGMSHTAPDGTLLRVNRRLCEMLGCTQEEMLGMKIQSRTHPDDLDKDLEQARQLLAGEIGTYSMEKRLFRKDDSVLWINLTVSLVREAFGEPDYLIAVCEDVDERKRAEREAQEVSRRTEDILQSVTDAFYALDREWRLTYLNERALRFASQLAGEEFTLDDLIGRTLWETLPAIVGTSIEAEYRRAVREQETAVFEYPYPGGGPIFEVHAYPSERGLSIYFQDVTERKRAEEAIRARTLQQAVVADLGLRALANHGLGSLLDDTVALVARTLDVECCRVVEILPGGEELLLRAGFGWQEGVVGSTAEIDPQVAYTLSSSGPVMFEDLEAETRFEPSPMLRTRGVVSGMTVLIPGREEPYGALGAHTVTRRTFSEEDANFLQTVANVLATAIERERTDRELGEAREAERSRIARDLHDEALQDLAYAMTQAQTVHAAPAGEETANHSVGLAAALKRVEQQLRGAIYDLRLEAEHDKPFSELLGSLVELHRVMAPDLDIRLDLRDGALEGPLKKVGRETLRIVGEALTNARRHSGARNVGVSVSTSDGRLFAEVSDDGRGVHPPRQPSPAGGLGIKGMRERARALGGELKIESEPAMGTKVRFEVALERKREEPESDVRVLLVEDHVAVREAVAAAFEREAGFAVVGQAGSLGTARRLLAEGVPVDVAVVDLGLPDGHGGDLIGDLRAANPEAQVLVLSASLDRAETARAVQSGAAGVLHKTAHLDEVVDSVERLRAGETLMPLEEVVELLRFAGTRKDEEYEARQAIESLTPREMEVLQTLAEGLDSEGIAESLHISVRTQRNHVASILAKLGVHSQLQALVFAVRHDAVKIS